ncbi:MAG: spore germination protein, partial [Oscillospiraceae bacterium]
MITYFKNKMNAILNKFQDNQDGSQPESEETRTVIVKELKDNMINLREKYKNSSDFLTREIKINDTSISFLMVEGMVNLQTMSEIMLEPLLNENFPKKSGKDAIYNFIQERSILAADMKDIFTYEEVFQFIMSGFVVILIDGLEKGIVFGMQGFNFRSISEPASEINERGSREGFTEPLRINMTMVRRRIKSPSLKFELMTVGKTSKTDICLMYMTDKVSNKLLREIRYKISQIKLDIILTSGYIQPFLEGKPWSLFSDVGTTERPDVLAAKINEGRVAIVVDGTPYALIVPYLFTENFQSLDDYAHRAYYASFIRIIKYFSFVATILLPALYVGVGTFHPELLPHALLFNISAAEEITPFPLMIEALIIHLLYEIMREAGLRLPRPIGHAVSIVGALVIGDAAVSAGLIGAPMVLV